MKIIGEGYTRNRKIGERSSYKCSECGAEYTDISDANACQAKHFDDRHKKKKMLPGAGTLAALDAPSIRTKPKISINTAPSVLPPEDDDHVPVLITQDNDALHDVSADEEENDLQSLADKLMEQYK